jgi:NAD(P) transhydrogenase subunit alpha
MKIIGSVKEDLALEKRISITLETVKKFTNLGFSINLEKNYSKHLGISDKDYESSGANISASKKDVFEKSDIILKVNNIIEEEINLIKSESILIGQIDTNLNKAIINELSKKNVKIFSLNLLPRISRAQSMDVLSSQANLAGYKAVIESFSKFEQAIPMMMTAAGTVPAAKVLVIGAGVAGLQAIATAKRMGAIVFATDVRAASKEQVESLGGKFLIVEDSENLETEEGYAKETSEDFKKKTRNPFKRNIEKN